MKHNPGQLHKKKFLIPKGHKPERCAVCGKALRVENKVGLCSLHFDREYYLNKYHQVLK